MKNEDLPASDLAKLEYAAIMAMNGILSNEGMSDEYSVVAYDAIAYAKKLLEQLEEEKNEKR
jgi:hypothetical protein